MDGTSCIILRSRLALDCGGGGSALAGQHRRNLRTERRSRVDPKFARSRGALRVRRRTCPRTCSNARRNRGEGPSLMATRETKAQLKLKLAERTVQLNQTRE